MIEINIVRVKLSTKLFFFFFNVLSIGFSFTNHACGIHKILIPCFLLLEAKEFLN